MDNAKIKIIPGNIGEEKSGKYSLITIILLMFVFPIITNLTRPKSL